MLPGIDKEKVATTTNCDRCNISFNEHERHEECGIHLCEKCHATHSILPGQYRYALLLWLCGHQCHGKTAGILPSFWPKGDNWVAMTPIEVITTALRDDLGQLPCGDICFCSHFSHEQEEDHTSNRQCFFLHLEENCPKGVSLLLYWWHIYYTRQSLPLPEFWPALDGGVLMSPQQLARSTTM